MVQIPHLASLERVIVSSLAVQVGPGLQGRGRRARHGCRLSRRTPSSFSPEGMRDASFNAQCAVMVAMTVALVGCRTGAGTNGSAWNWGKSSSNQLASD